MLLRSAPIQSVELTTTAAAIYTVPSGFNGTLRQLSACNRSGTARTITIYHVPSGGSAANANTVVSALTVQPSGVQGGVVPLAHLFAGRVLATGDTIQALCSANSAVNLGGGALEETV